MRLSIFLENFQFNTAIAALMKLSNIIQEKTGLSTNLKVSDRLPPANTVVEAIEDTVKVDMVRSPSVKKAIEKLLIMLMPMAPHFVSEVWTQWWHTTSTPFSRVDLRWPSAEDPVLFKKKTQQLVVQVGCVSSTLLQCSDTRKIWYLY